MSKRVPTTIYLDPKIAKAMKMKAAVNNSSMSDIVNDAVAAELERDRKDLEIFKQRRNSPTISYEELLRRAKRDGLL